MPLTLSLAVLACGGLSPAAATATPAPPTVAVATDTPANPAASDTPGAPAATDTVAPAEPSATSEAPAATDTPAAPPAPQFIAYVDPLRNLLVTDVTGDVLGGTTQYTQLAVEGQVLDLTWSPSGEYVAFVTSAPDNVHVYYVYAVGAGTPVDLGLGANVAWSPDSAHIAFVRDTQEQLPHGYSFLDKTHDLISDSENSGTFTIDVPANGQVTVGYGIRWKIN